MEKYILVDEFYNPMEGFMTSISKSAEYPRNELNTNSDLLGDYFMIFYLCKLWH